MSTRTKVAILDRDGTLIDVVRDEDTGIVTTAFHPSHLRLLPGVVEGLRVLQGAGFALGMATNQPGPAKGHFRAEAVTRTNDALLELLAKDRVTFASVKVCMDHPEGGPGGDPSLVGPSTRRKPAPGMLLEILAELGADPAASWMVGDGEADVEAGLAAGVQTALLLAAGRCELCPLRPGGAKEQATKGRPHLWAPTFLEIARAIAAR